MGNLGNYDPAITDGLADGREGDPHRQRRRRTRHWRGTGDRRRDGADAASLVDALPIEYFAAPVVFDESPFTRIAGSAPLASHYMKGVWS